MTAPAAEPDRLDSPGAGRTAIRGSATRTAGFGVVTVLSLASATALARHLDVVAFGQLATVLSLVAIVATVTEAGLNALGVRELSILGPAERRGLMRDLLGIRIVLTILGVLAAVGFAALAGYDDAMVVGTAVAGVGLLTYVLSAAFGLPLAADLRLGWVTVTEVFRQVVYTAAVIGLVAAGAGLVPLLGASIAGGLAATALCVWLVRGTVPWQPRFRVASWRPILRETLPLAAASAVYHVYFRIVMLLMSLLTTGVATGVFALSFRIVEVLVLVPLLAVGSLLPLLTRAARDDHARLAFAFERTLAVALIAGTGITVVTVVGAPLGIELLTGRPAPAAVEVLRIQALAVLAVFLTQTYSWTFIALRRHRDLLVLNGVTLAITVAISLVLIPAAGAVGGAWATVAGEWVLLLAYVLTVRRFSLPLRPSLRRLPGVAAAAAAGLAAGLLIEVPLLPRLAAVALSGTAYLAVLVAARALPPELTGALRPVRGGARAR